MNLIPACVLIIAKDEALAIERCVSSVAAFEQVVVVDSCSSDGTPALAARAGAEVLDFRWDGRYPKKKQWALDNVHWRHDWVLLLDGDEYATPSLLQEVREKVTAPNPQFAAYDIALDYHFLGRKLRFGHRVYKRVLLNRHAVRFPELDDLEVPNPFEMELHVQPLPVSAGAPIGRLQSLLQHDDREPLAHYFDRHNRYSDWEALLRTNAPAGRLSTTARTRGGRIWQRVPAKPLMFFLYSYVARQGFRDGRAGFDYALSLSFYYWQISVKVAERQRSQ